MRTILLALLLAAPAPALAIVQPVHEVYTAAMTGTVHVDGGSLTATITGGSMSVTVLTGSMSVTVTGGSMSVTIMSGSMSVTVTGGSMSVTIMEDAWSRSPTAGGNEARFAGVFGQSYVSGLFAPVTVASFQGLLGAPAGNALMTGICGDVTGAGKLVPFSATIDGDINQVSLPVCGPLPAGSPLLTINYRPVLSGGFADGGNFLSGFTGHTWNTFGLYGQTYGGNSAAMLAQDVAAFAMVRTGGPATAGAIVADVVTGTVFAEGGRTGIAQDVMVHQAPGTSWTITTNGAPVPVAVNLSMSPTGGGGAAIFSGLFVQLADGKFYPVSSTPTSDSTGVNRRTPADTTDLGSGTPSVGSIVLTTAGATLTFDSTIKSFHWHVSGDSGATAYVYSSLSNIQDAAADNGDSSGYITFGHQQSTYPIIVPALDYDDMNMTANWSIYFYTRGGAVVHWRALKRR